MSKLPLVFAVAVMSVAPVFAASARAEGAPVRLSTRSVDFTDPAAVKAFYARVRAAARAVCSSDSLTLGSREDEDCRSRFIRDAVHQVDEPLLTAVDSRAAPGSMSAGR